MVDLRPSLNVRCEVAFATMPDDPAPAWVDLTSRVDLVAGISRSYGAADEFATVQPSSCSVTLDNADGALTPGNPSSPYYPNVRPQRRIRLSYRDPSANSGNLLAVEDASFEGGTIGSWVGVGSPTLTNSTAHPKVGARGLLVSFATSGFSSARISLNGLTVGRAYAVSAWVWVPTGSPDVTLLIDAGPIGSIASTKNALVQLAGTFTATASLHFLHLSAVGGSTAGQTMYVDAVQVDEGTSIVGPFTTASPPITYLFTGHVEEWPTEWPGGQLYSQSTITATDRLARIGSRRAMRSVIEEAILQDSPAAYYPLGEPVGSTLAGDASGAVKTSILAVAQYGSGGTLEFGTSTGPPTDGLPAPTFTPSGLNGKYLTGSFGGVGGFGFPSVSLRANFLTSTAAKATIVRLSDAYGSYLQLEVTAAGKLRASTVQAFVGTDDFSLTSAATVSDGATHDAVVTLSLSGSTVTATLYLDGVSAGSTTFSTPALMRYSTVSVGGHSGGNVFTGTVSHVAAFSTVLTLAKIGVHYTATSTGFKGERSDQRIARYASWAGVPAGEINLDVGSSASVAFTETTGQSILQAMQDVAQTEGGRLFVNGAGVLTFHARSRRYANAAAVASVDAENLSGSEQMTLSTQGLVNDITGQRPDGPQVRAFDSASISEFGVFNQSLSLLVTTDNEVADAVNWRVSTNAQPMVRLPQATFDLYTDPTVASALWPVELGDRVTVTTLPSQVGSSSLDFMVEGYSENISLAGWTRTANLSNYSDVLGLILDDNVYGLLDGDNRLVY